MDDLLAEFWSSTECEHHEEMRRLNSLLFTNENPLPVVNCMKSVLCEWVEMKLGGEYSIICNDKTIQVHFNGKWYKDLSWPSAWLLMELIK